MISLSIKRSQLHLYRYFRKFYLSTGQPRSAPKQTKMDLREEFSQILNSKEHEEDKNKNINHDENDQKKSSECNEELDCQNDKSQKSQKSEKSSTEDEKNNNTYSDGNPNNNKKKEEINNKSGPNPFSKFINGFVKVWKQTFPGEQNFEAIHELRKKEAKILKEKIKEPTEEEIAIIEAEIPEWKRGALVLVSNQPEPERFSIFEQARRNLTIHIKNLGIYQDSIKKYQNSEVKLLVNDLKESYTNVKENIKDSQNPLFVVSRDLLDRVPFNSPSSMAISVMRKQDPSFELVIFEKEVEFVFKQLMSAFIKDDLDMVKLLSSEMALAVLTSEIRSRRERNIECKYKELLYVDTAQYMSADIPEEDTCILRFRINTQEINCKISRKDGQVVEGDVSLVENIHYIIDITRNPEPVIEEVGHPWVIVGLQRVGVIRQLL